VTLRQPTRRSFGVALVRLDANRPPAASPSSVQGAPGTCERVDDEAAGWAGVGDQGRQGFGWLLGRVDGPAAQILGPEDRAGPPGAVVGPWDLTELPARPVQRIRDRPPDGTFPGRPVVGDARQNVVDAAPVALIPVCEWLVHAPQPVSDGPRASVL